MPVPAGRPAVVIVSVPLRSLREPYPGQAVRDHRPWGVTPAAEDEFGTGPALGEHEVPQPVGQGLIIVVDEGDKVGAAGQGLADSPVARVRDAPLRLGHVDGSWVLGLAKALHPIIGMIVYDEHEQPVLGEIGQIGPADGLKAGRQPIRTVTGAHADSDRCRCGRRRCMLAAVHLRPANRRCGPVRAGLK